MGEQQWLMANNWTARPPERTGGGQQAATTGPAPTDPNGPRENTSGANAIVAEPQPEPPDEMLPSTS